MTTHPSATGLPDPSLRADFYAGIRTKRLVAWVFDVVLIGVISVIMMCVTDRRQGLTDLILNTAAINRPRW